MATIILTSGAFALTFGASGARFTNASFPREKVGGPSLSYSSYGSPIREGTFYEPKHIWNLEALLDANNLLILDRLYSAWLLSRPVPNIVLTDLTRRISEPSPRTRSLASGTVESASGAIVSYFANFNAEFSQEPKYSKEGKFVRAQVQLMETVKTAP